MFLFFIFSTLSFFLIEKFNSVFIEFEYWGTHSKWIGIKRTVKQNVDLNENVSEFENWYVCSYMHASVQKYWKKKEKKEPFECECECVCLCGTWSSKLNSKRNISELLRQRLQRLHAKKLFFYVYFNHVVWRICVKLPIHLNALICVVSVSVCLVYSCHFQYSLSLSVSENNFRLCLCLEFYFCVFIVFNRGCYQMILPIWVHTMWCRYTSIQNWPANVVN